MKVSLFGMCVSVCVRECECVLAFFEGMVSIIDSGMVIAFQQITRIGNLLINASDDWVQDFKRAHGMK